MNNGETIVGKDGVIMTVDDEILTKQMTHRVGQKMGERLSVTAKLWSNGT